jgi:hypothetical protein
LTTLTWISLIRRLGYLVNLHRENNEMANPQNLKKPWAKGESGNPKGRPKVIPDLRELLANVLGDTKDGKSAAEAILMGLRAKAVKGDVRAAELLLNRAYGKVADIVLNGNASTVIMPKPPSEE